MARLIGRRAFLGAAAALGASVAAVPARAAFNDPIVGTATLGVAGPFTGDSIRLGEQMGNGVRAAIDEANRLRGPMDKLFAMRTFDDQNALAGALVNAQFAVDDGGVNCVIGHLSGRITEQTLQTYVNGHLPLIIPATTFDRVTAHGYASVVRLATKDSTEGNLAGGFVAGREKPKVSAVLYQDGDYGIDVAAGFHERMLREHVDSKAIRFSFEKPDYAAASRETVSYKPDVVYLAGTVKDMGPMLHQLRADGYAGPLFASQGFFDAATIAKYKTEAEGVIVSTSMPPLQIAPSIYRIRLDFEQKYGPFTPLAAFSYAAAQVAIAAIRRGGSADRIAVARALNSSMSFDTVIGPVAFLNTGDPQDPNVYFYAVKDGKWSYVQAAHRSTFVLK
jgi:branched-chain amino acid transport system substrate-binding protein